MWRYVGTSVRVRISVSVERHTIGRCFSEQNEGRFSYVQNAADHTSVYSQADTQVRPMGRSFRRTSRCPMMDNPSFELVKLLMFHGISTSVVRGKLRRFRDRPTWTLNVVVGTSVVERIGRFQSSAERKKCFQWYVCCSQDAKISSLTYFEAS